jgi:hypothetical protein
MPAVSEFTKVKTVTLHQRGMSYGQISTNLGLSKGTLHAIMEVGTHWDGGFGVQVLEEGGCLPWNRTRQSSTSCRIGLSLTLRISGNNSFPGVGENCSSMRKGKWDKELRGSKKNDTSPQGSQSWFCSTTLATG